MKQITDIRKYVIIVDFRIFLASETHGVGRVVWKMSQIIGKYSDQRLSRAMFHGAAASRRDLWKIMLSLMRLYKDIDSAACE